MLIYFLNKPETLKHLYVWTEYPWKKIINDSFFTYILSNENDQKR